jgi:CRP-like cAMP-binding protein
MLSTIKATAAGSKLFESRELSALMAEYGTRHRLKRKEIIFREGSQPAYVFFLEKGIVKKYKTTSKGGEQIFYVCSPGELFGYHAVIGEENYPDSAAAMSEVIILYIPKERFILTLNQYPVLAFRLLKALGKEFSLFVNAIAGMATKSVSERLAFNLLWLEEKLRNGKSAEEPTIITLSRADLASLVGTSKETTVRFLQQFKKSGLIDVQGNDIHLLDREQLMKEAGSV